MSSASDYQKRVEALDREALVEMWRAIQRQNTPEWESGKAFEYLTLRAFQLEGADVVYPYSVRFGGEEVEQIDGFIYADSLSCLIECKDQQGNVNIEPIAKMRNQLMRRHASTIGGIVQPKRIYSVSYQSSPLHRPSNDSVMEWQRT